VVIDYRPLGGGKWVERRHLSTGADGRYSTPLTARRSGVYRARSAAGAPSRAVEVAVAFRVRARAERSVLAGQRATIKGSVRPGVRGRRVAVHVGGGTLGARTDRRGRFRVRWTAAAPGRYRVRAVAEGDRSATRGADHGGRVTVFRRAVASWYGPGLYGNGVACGGTLQPSTLGVANRTLPCGTKVTLRYRGRQVTVPVIDRGPYVAGRDYDLTAATRARLHFTGGVGTLLSSR
jgi:rare lipoprotein A